MLAGSQLLKGARATERALKALESPSILHVATHGFFLRSTQQLARGSRGLVLVEQGAAAEVAEDPLLKAGLALAGANGVPADPEVDDGILTALEALSLDLTGTQLVALSACQTGVGEVTNGDGVMGLRRALVLAGSATQLISLWDVDDDATARLMESYYRSLLTGRSRRDALQDAQLSLMGDPTYAHPRYWSAFLLSGDASSLDAATLRELKN